MCEIANTPYSKPNSFIQHDTGQMFVLSAFREFFFSVIVQPISGFMKLLSNTICEQKYKWDFFAKSLQWYQKASYLHFFARVACRKCKKVQI